MSKKYFARVFLQILDSSIAKDFMVRHVFEDFLKLAEWRTGIVDIPTDVIARRLNMPEDELRRCIHVLEAPDPISRSEKEEGRRLRRIDDHRDWGWVIINWNEYNEKLDKAANQERVDRHRRRKASAETNGLTGGNTPEHAIVPHGTSTGTPAAEIPTSHIPTKDQTKAWLEDAVEKGGSDYTWAEVQRAYLYLGSIGWMTGRDKKVPCVDWRLMLEGQIQKDRDHDASNSGNNGKGSGQPKAADRPRVFPESHQKYGCESGYTDDKLRAKAAEDGLPAEAVEEYLKYRKLKGL